MADPVSINFTLQNLKCAIQCMQFYQQMAGDQTNNAQIASLNATLAANVTPGAEPVGMPSALARSAFGQT